jgi:hypothetical protein
MGTRRLAGARGGVSRVGQGQAGGGEGALVDGVGTGDGVDTVPFRSTKSTLSTTSTYVWPRRARGAAYLPIRPVLKLH